MSLDPSTTSTVITASKLVGTLGAAWYTFYNTTLTNTALPSVQSVAVGIPHHFQLKLWQDIDAREKTQGRGIALVSAASFLTAYALQPNGFRQPYLPLCAGLLIAIVPYTAIVMAPVHERLITHQVDAQADVISTQNDLEEYKSLTLGRAAISAVAVAFAAYGLVRR